MAQLTIDVNGRPYVVGCENGQEPHLLELARLLDGKVREVAQQVGPLGETRLLLMGALLLADDLAEAKARLAAGEGGPAPAAPAADPDIERRAIAALTAAAERIEALSAG